MPGDAGRLKQHDDEDAPVEPAGKIFSHDPMFAAQGGGPRTAHNLHIERPDAPLFAGNGGASERTRPRYGSGHFQCRGGFQSWRPSARTVATASTGRERCVAD